MFDFKNTPITKDTVLRAVWDCDSQLTKLKKALNTGNAEELFPVGTMISDTWNDVEAPLVVMQYLNETNSNLYGGVNGVILMRHNITDYTSSQKLWAEGQPIKNYLDSEYLEACSGDMKKYISPIKIRTNLTYNSTTPANEREYIMVDSLWFPPSVKEMYCRIGNTTTGIANTPDEGIAWDYWKAKFGDEPARYSTDYPEYAEFQYAANGYNGASWLRTSITGSSSSNHFCVRTGADINQLYNRQFRWSTACFIAKN